MVSSNDYLLGDLFANGGYFGDALESVERFIIHEAGQPLGVMVIEAPDELGSDIKKLSCDYSNIVANRRKNHFVAKSLINGFISDVNLLYSRLSDCNCDNLFKSDVRQLMTVVNYFNAFNPKQVLFSDLFSNYLVNISSFNSDGVIGISNSSLVDYGLLIDSSKFNFLLLNLGKNSIKAINARFGRDYGGFIDVKVRRDGDSFVLTHYDNGCGMRPDESVKLFNTGFTSDSNKDVHGLGSLIIKEIVDAHRGVISVSSKLGAGTKVKVRLPVRQ